MKPGLETAIRELLEYFREDGMPTAYASDRMIAPHILRLLSEFDIETGNSETVDIPVTDGQVKRGCNRHSDCEAAEIALLAKNPDMTKTQISLSFHCHDDECEDCFGC
jgi:hypothetical protein